MKKGNKCEINNCNKNQVVGNNIPPFCEYHNGRFFEYSVNNFLNLQEKGLKNLVTQKDFQQLFILKQLSNFKKIYESKKHKE
ncbi:hypothetical protein [Spiroplasma melliferum]|uniref:hypothetical protein n=1 Tax=Spiroplasma melliferum TaxID=2134 RepID=UPI000C758DA1|nr:hypothetical protein [Spiroplasma melliferum]